MAGNADQSRPMLMIQKIILCSRGPNRCKSEPGTLIFLALACFMLVSSTAFLYPYLDSSTSLSPQPTQQKGAGREFPAAPLPLSDFPRPPDDNGLGVHWSTYLYGQSDEATDFFVSELTGMNIKWVKLLNDGTTGRHHDDTIDQLVAHGIMPILRIYQECNIPYDAKALDDLVRYYVARGVYYYELYNEPDQVGRNSGWCQPGGEPQPEYLAQIWADAARVVYQAGGYPSLPSFFAPSQKLEDWEEDFFYKFFHALKEQGNEDTLYFSWAAVHNYGLNHPPTYPYDDVNLTGRVLTEEEIDRYGLTPKQVSEINQARKTAREPGGFFLGDNLYDDSTCFFHFIAYHDQFYDLFGFEIPMISTEGGTVPGSDEDPRYPVTDGQTVADWTLWSADYLLDDAPEYYFATSNWLLAQRALEYDEPGWEKHAWFHDREDDREPVVDALKRRPRLQEARVLFERDGIKDQRHRNLLSAYPRPKDDNGRGIHWSPTNQPQPRKMVDYFLQELREMNIKWVKLLQDDQPDLPHSYLIEQLVANDIEPVLRIYKPFNEPYEHLSELVPKAKEEGVHYFELFTEPNIAGQAGGWREGEPISIERIVDLWILAAREIHAAGAHPGLPSLAPGGTIDDMIFMARFLDGLRARGQTGLLPGAWIPMHNYFLNHPLDYPADPVNVHDVPLTKEEIAERELTPEQVAAINHDRRIAKLPREQGGFWVGNTIHEDSNGFRKFEAYADIFYRRFGYYLPIISTEGGAVVGAAEDPRYPPVREEDVTTLTLGAYHAMLDDAPPYFFAHTPWLIANRAGGHADERFEQAAWYKDREGTTLPVVQAIKADPRRNEVRAWREEQPLISAARMLPIVTTTPIIVVIDPTPCPFDAAYVSDVTIPDHTVVAPGERIDKTWRVRNAGPCAWEPGSQLTFLSGAQMNAPDSQEVDPIAPGETADITVTMYAPEAPGDYTGVWHMTDAQGEPFGENLTVVIQVPSPHPPTPTPLPPPPPKQFSAQLVRWWPNCGIALVKGKIVEHDGAPVNGLRMRVWADSWDGSLSLVSGIGLSYGPGEWDVLLRQGQTGKFYVTVWDWQTGPDSYTRVDSEVLELDFNYTLENCQPEGDGHQVAEVQFIRNY